MVPTHPERSHCPRPQQDGRGATSCTVSGPWNTDSMTYDEFDTNLMLERFRSQYGASNARLELHPGQDPEFTLTIMFSDARPDVVVQADEADDAEHRAIELLSGGSSDAS